MSINRNNNESIRAFAVRVQIDAAKFDGTDYEVKSKALACSWRKGLGSDFQSINKMINETGIIPNIWIKKFSLHQLVNKPELYLHARRVKDADDKKKDEKNKTEENLYRLINIRSRIFKVVVERNAPQMVLLISCRNSLTRKWKTGKIM